jgi:hypothetical protein
MIRTIKKTTLVAALVMGVAPQIAVAAPSVAGDNPMLQYYKVNEKYACTPEELADYIKERRKPLDAKPNVVTATKFVQNEITQKKDDGEDNCLTLFDNLNVVKEINDLIKKIQDMSMPDFSTDGMGLAAQELGKRLMESAMNSVCNALTKEAATNLINEIMSRELGYDMDDAKEFDAKSFAKEIANDHAEDYLESKDIDPDWLDEENHQDLMKDEIDDQKDTLKDSLFED